MRHWMHRAIVGVAILIGAGVGCSSREDESSKTEDTAPAETPATRAKANNDEGAAALAESDKGVDNDGDKTWKQDAREYFADNNNATFKLPRTWATEFTGKLYTAGAERVWVTRISATDLGGRKFNISDDLLIVLPTDAAKRKAIFDLYNAEMKDDESKFPDVGQKYIHIVAD